MIALRMRDVHVITWALRAVKVYYGLSMSQSCEVLLL